MIAHGSVLCARSGLLEVRLPGAAVGHGVRVQSAHGEITGIVTALHDGCAIVAAHDVLEGVRAGDAVCTDPAALAMLLGTMALGRSFDARGNALDGGPPLQGRSRSLAVRPPQPWQRAPIRAPFWTGIRAVDALLTIGRGARVGVFGAPGCGKSTIVELLVRGSAADAVVVALIGERGREAQEWMSGAGPWASIVCATGDRSAAERVRAARVAMAHAHALRASGLHVLLVLDSLARLATALREIAVSAGEPVGRGGYPASVFAELAGYVEVAGTSPRGSITLVATVLSDGDERDPVSECARALLDGHIQLSPVLANAGRYPAIDVPASASRTMHAVISEPHSEDGRLVRGAIARLAETADARALGLGAGGDRDSAAAQESAIAAFLQQGKRPETPSGTLLALHALADTLR